MAKKKKRNEGIEILADFQSLLDSAECKWTSGNKHYPASAVKYDVKFKKKHSILKLLKNGNILHIGKLISFLQRKQHNEHQICMHIHDNFVYSNYGLLYSLIPH